jgi:WD40 repeat protein
LFGHKNYVTCFFGLNDTHFASGSQDRKIILWDLNEKKMKLKLENAHTESIKHLVQLESGDLASASQNEIIIWNSINWLFKYKIDKFESYLNVMILLNNGDLVTGHENSDIIVWDMNSRNEKYQLVDDHHKDVILSLVELPNGELASCSFNNNDIIVFI